MFSTPSIFYSSFDVEQMLTEQELACYKGRAKGLRERFPWSSTLEPLWRAFLVHLSANVPGKIAYYASIQNMMAGRLTRTSPEMFLDRTLTFAPDELRAAWSLEVLNATLPELSFVKNDNPDEWYRIYKLGPNSCMKGSDQIRKYAHPDNNLALAYVQDSAGRITHRTIVNQVRKTYVRAYGEDPAFFIAALNKKGYTRDADTLRKEFINIDYLTCPDCKDSFLQGPFLDGDFGLIQPISSTEGIIGNEGDEPIYNEICPCGCRSDSDDDYDDDDNDE